MRNRPGRDVRSATCLADAVLQGRTDDARRLAERIKQEENERRQRIEREKRDRYQGAG